MLERNISAEDPFAICRADQAALKQSVIYTCLSLILAYKM
jgi:hypothetical protein